jgi:hypothetical protein
MRERSKQPLILCGHGVSLSVESGALAIRSGFTHYPQKQETYRFFKGELAVPPRIVMLDGSGNISFDVPAWLSEQNVPLPSVIARNDEQQGCDAHKDVRCNQHCANSWPSGHMAKIRPANTVEMRRMTITSVIEICSTGQCNSDSVAVSRQQCAHIPGETCLDLVPIRYRTLIRYRL